MKIMHDGLKDFLLLSHLIKDQKILFLSLNQPLPKWVKQVTNSLPSYGLGLQIRREYRHVSMALEALRKIGKELTS